MEQVDKRSMNEEILSDAAIGMDTCKALVSDVQQIHSKHFYWVILNFIFHGAIQHSAQLIEKKDKHGLVTFSKEALKVNNKD